MAKFDTSFVVRDLEDKALKARDGQKDLTAGEVLLIALQYEEPQQNVSQEDRCKRFLLSARIATAKGPVDFSSEDVVYLKRVVGSTRWIGNGVVITGRICDWLECKTGAAVH